MTTLANRLLDPEAWTAWKNSPLTQEYLRFLREHQDRLTQAWARGASLAPEQQAQAVLLGKLADLSLEDLNEHYGVEGDE